MYSELPNLAVPSVLVSSIVIFVAAKYRRAKSKRVLPESAIRCQFHSAHNPVVVV